MESGRSGYFGWGMGCGQGGRAVGGEIGVHGWRGVHRMRIRGVGRKEWSRCLHCDFIQLSSIDHGAITTIRIIALAFIIIPKWTLIHPMMIMEMATFIIL